MKGIRYISTFLLAGLFFVSLSWLYPVSGFADVCNEGIGIPPFLSSGTKPNLLMVLDNSGSMLDMAYSSSRVDARCLDGDYEIVSYDNQGNKQIDEVVTGYDGTRIYGGYFENETWYTWAQTGHPPWKTATSYTEGDRVYAYGNIYVATSSGTSSGTTIDKDTQVDWERLFSIKKWANYRIRNVLLKMYIRSNYHDWKKKIVQCLILSHWKILSRKTSNNIWR